MHLTKMKIVEMHFHDGSTLKPLAGVSVSVLHGDTGEKINADITVERNRAKIILPGRRFCIPTGSINLKHFKIALKRNGFHGRELIFPKDFRDDNEYSETRLHYVKHVRLEHSNPE